MTSGWPLISGGTQIVTALVPFTVFPSAICSSFAVYNDRLEVPSQGATTLIISVKKLAYKECRQKDYNGRLRVYMGYRGGSPTAVQAWQPCPL